MAPQQIRLHEFAPFLRHLVHFGAFRGLGMAAFGDKESVGVRNTLSETRHIIEGSTILRNTKNVHVVRVRSFVQPKIRE
jgi:hypothetical protein